MATNSERRSAREAVAAYHEARLTELVLRVGEGIERFRAGELDAFDTDQIIFQYTRAAKELWKFCNLPDVVFTARAVSESPPADVRQPTGAPDQYTRAGTAEQLKAKPRSYSTT